MSSLLFTWENLHQKYCWPSTWQQVANRRPELISEASYVIQFRFHGTYSIRKSNPENSFSQIFSLASYMIHNDNFFESQ